MSKRNPRLAASSIAAHRRLMADKPIECPPQVREVPGGQEAWDAIIALRVSCDWPAHQLHQVAQLSILTALANLELGAIVNEGTLVLGPKGLPVQNPRIPVAQALLNGAGSLRRGMGLNVSDDPRILNLLPARRSMAKKHAQEDDDDLIG